MSFDKHIVEIQAGLRSGRFGNEAAVSQGIVLRLLHALSWPTYDTQIICPEYSLEGRRVDFALCHPPGKPMAFVEVKQVGHSEGAERQLFEYAFHTGVPLAILTDGQEWSFFLPGEQGDYGERRFYKLDILERDVSESSLRLTRDLKYENIVSGLALDNAREDYRDASRQRQMKGTFPEAWRKLVEEEDAQLLELIADRVESLCGFKPDLDSVARFLKDQMVLRNSGGQPGPGPQPTPPPKPVRVKPHVASTSTGFTLHGEHFPARSAREVLVKVFQTLSVRDSMFLERFASLPTHGRKRRYLARDPEDLYPGRSDLARDHSVQLDAVWWLGTNVSRAATNRIIEMACHVAHLRFGIDLQVNLGE